MNAVQPGSGQSPDGFKTSPRRMLAEFGLLLGGLGVLLALTLWVAGLVADRAVSWLPVELDQQLGERVWSLQQLTACRDPNAERYVAELTRRLTDKRRLPWHFQLRIADTDQVNAFALPGGYVTVNRGLLEAAESSEEVAAVLAHEFMHVTERHGLQRMFREVGRIALLSAFLGSTDLEGLALLASGLASSAYDREQEAEADRLGLELLRDAGISAGGMATFFERLNKGSNLPQWLSTHPDPGIRATAAASQATVTHGTPLPPLVQVQCQ